MPSDQNEKDQEFSEEQDLFNQQPEEQNEGRENNSE